ncbi:Dihydrolipoyllysine-residue acetyltransferase component 1 of pyruvate dehydrogenase complex, mitochondrial [Frankliniella fusca]|uniref:Dihydrolipoamide acetyltransferase component of pyruvate dehydrogenase complex n=1 Tax=Frankliniella fusca TaxID=407009 RepID=A0AAE1HRD5_9NEOP|nr:Dihydrolipoyllysine-residue acetyltransferase component 1 of pyruvate dehydrogenase complex, mitochondrial [Frankliniella fusca]
MAAVTKVRLGGLSQKLLKTFVTKPPLFRNHPKLCFHHSAILQVAGQEIKMPSLSPTMTEGTIVKWLKKEGDAVAPGDVLCEIQTDKAVMSFEVEEEGILAKIILPDDSKDVKVGSLIALMVAEGEDWQSVELPSGSGAPAAASPAPSASTPAAAPLPTGGSVPGTAINMPSLSPTMTEGTIVKWLKKEGDTVAPGDVLCEIQTDKAVMSFEVEEEGILAKILVPDDSNVKVGTLIALMVGEGEDWKDVAIPGSAAPAAAATPTPSAAPKASAPSSGGHAHSDLKMGPAVRTLLEAYQMSPSEVSGTGPHGLLTKGDVLQVIKQRGLTAKAPKPVPPPASAKSPSGPSAQPTKTSPQVASLKPTEGFTDIELTSMRKTIAKRLTESKTQIPHSYGLVECQVDKVMALRKQLKSENINVSINDFVIKAVAVALQQVPEINALFSNDKLSVSNVVDISVAVATPNGLITPIIKDADRLGLVQISQKMKELAGKAKEGKLQPQEFMGGTFTISNLGMFGISEFSAIINPPQVAILAVGGGRPELDGEGNLRTMMTATLSYDRRAVDEVQVANFLEVVQRNLENPNMMIVGGVPGSEGAEERQALGL